MQLVRTDDKFKEVLTFIESLEEVKIGAKYRLAGSEINVRNHRGQDLVLVDETNTDKGIMFITDENGKQPFAVMTNDSVRDSLTNCNTLSSVVVKTGYNLFVALHAEGPTNIYGFKVIDIDNRDEGELHVECFHKKSSLYEIPGFKNAYKHTIKALRQKNVKVQLQDKYCFQTTRKVHLCLMTRDNSNELVCNKNGKIMTLNNHSYAKRNLFGDVYPEGFFRVYYSKRFDSSPLVYVEGVKIDDESLDINPEEYLLTAETDLRDSLVEVVTKKGMKFYAILTPRGEIRPILKLGTFISFTLSETEIAESVESIVKYSDKNKVINI